MEFHQTSREKLKAYLISNGLKSTKQRDLIVDAFLDTKDHIDIESLYVKVKRKHPKIGYATVYRTMKLLKDSGVASERHFGTRHAVYEPDLPDQHHDHLICTACGKIVEFENPAIEALQIKIAKKYKFVLKYHKHELYGLCEDCQNDSNH